MPFAENYAKYNSMIGSHMEILHKNPYVSSVLVLILVVYASYVQPPLPSYLVPVFKHVVFRGIMITLGLYYLNKNILLSLGITTVFLVVMYLINNEGMTNVFNKKNRYEEEKEEESY
jgi:hypothetical protein